jgi:hypothetical protein
MLALFVYVPEGVRECVKIFLYVRMCRYVYVGVSVYVCVCMYLYVFVYLYICAYGCLRGCHLCCSVYM